MDKFYETTHVLFHNADNFFNYRYIEKRVPWMSFVDPEKAFDRVPREMVFLALRKSFGVTKELVTELCMKVSHNLQ